MYLLNSSISFLVFLTLIFHQPNTNRIVQKSQSEYKYSSDTLFDFENYKLNKIPTDWKLFVTGKGELCNWKIKNDGEGNKVLAQLSKDKTDYHFNLIINESLNYKDVQLQINVKGVSGKGDQGGGPVWRFQNENNYYVARINPLENNFRVYKVVNGNRKELKSANIKINTAQWYKLKISMLGNEIKCYLNGELALETTDNTFTDSGKIGLWTKSDAVSYFDDFSITEAY
ncbi:family 16 glycoside hydrolase [Ancylomarina longa]|uniref:DUF1080 domain-containing protein n=1 Tax=Ancylomarina longa TaxID=2487017 RepID=A0A434AX71_9BACT|nr:family 16 glycoside hydrolase [Ancylomarina longa]RUT79119.1 DUF1080 domain-containing protein [Ancylomarina longa]